MMVKMMERKARDHYIPNNFHYFLKYKSSQYHLFIEICTETTVLLVKIQKSNSVFTSTTTQTNVFIHFFVYICLSYWKCHYGLKSNI